MIIKRNGNKVPYDIEKIKIAVSKAYKEVRPDISDECVCDRATKVSDLVDRIISNKSEDISVEDIQDIVEDVLIGIDNDVAKAYIKYRYKREMARNSYDELMHELNEKISARNIVNQNANVDEESFGGRIGETADLVAKRLALDYYVSPMARKNHEENMIYIHDLAAYAVGSHNCLSIPFDDLLKNGFNTRQTDVRPAQSINTAFQLVAVIFQLQSLNQFGGASATHIDWTMIPYVRKSFIKHFSDGLKYVSCPNERYHLDKFIEYIELHGIENISIEDEYLKDAEETYRYAMDMTVRETYQAVEGMYHNLKIIRAA